MNMNDFKVIQVCSETFIQGNVFAVYYFLKHREAINEGKY